jgi:putative peptide maturation dehydrogenase
VDLLGLLFSVPQRAWIEIDDSRGVRKLCERGLLLDERDTELRARDEQLSRDQWLPAAAAYHFATRLRDADLALPNDTAQVAAEANDAAVRFVDRHGPPPEHFHATGGARVELPLVQREGGLYDALGERKTTRGFDAARPLALEAVAVLLYEVFGCRAYTRLHPEVIALRKSSPSGGGLHPVEVYLLAHNVEGLDAGLYHYAVEEHQLEHRADLGKGEAGAAIGAFTAGQTYLESAAVLFVLTARFSRSFWKYRRHPTAYATLLYDAAHLSQSFYLVCTDLRLGAFFTNVINGPRIEEALALDGYREGVLAICGCGVPAAEGSPLDPEFLPYVPGKTAI